MGSPQLYRVPAIQIAVQQVQLTGHNEQILQVLIVFALPMCQPQDSDLAAQANDNKHVCGVQNPFMVLSTIMHDTRVVWVDQAHLKVENADRHDIRAFTVLQLASSITASALKPSRAYCNCSRIMHKTAFASLLLFALSCPASTTYVSAASQPAI